MSQRPHSYLKLNYASTHLILDLVVGVVPWILSRNWFQRFPILNQLTKNIEIIKDRYLKTITSYGCVELVRFFFSLEERCIKQGIIIQTVITNSTFILGIRGYTTSLDKYLTLNFGRLDRCLSWGSSSASLRCWFPGRCLLLGICMHYKWWTSFFMLYLFSIFMLKWLHPTK